jgi:hypothetical protein
VSSNPPLLQLLKQNINDAVKLGLLDPSAREVDDFTHKLESDWIPDLAEKAQRLHFNECMLKAITSLDRAYRPIQAFRGKTLKIVNVRSFASFSSWVPTIIGRPNTDFENLTKLNGLDHTNALTAERACLELSQNYGAGVRYAKGKLFTASEIAPNTRSFWIGRTPNPSSTKQAQYWRDRLGLIHIEGSSSPNLGDALVRIEFQIELSSTELLRTDPKKNLAIEPNGIWLVRPSMTHFGNHRFVQRHQFDKSSSSPRVHGRTRDLASSNFDIGERELLLVYGEEAKIRFRSVEMLEGYPAEIHSRDNSDTKFVSEICE